MNDLNLCQFIGRLGQAPEVRYSSSGDALSYFSIACGSQWKDKATGDKKESVEWVSCTVFGKLAEICGQYLQKGAQVYVSGKLKTEKYQDKEGKDRYSTKIIVSDMQMLGKSDSDGQQPKQPDAPIPGKPIVKGSVDDLDDDIPFN